jgi:hypothetical protein
VLQERDQRGRGRDHLTSGNIHVVHFGAGHVLDLAALGADQYAILGVPAIGRQRCVGLGDDVLVLLVGRQVVDLVGDLAVLHLAVGRLHKTERVDASVGGERADQADVRAFGGLDRAHAAVVRGVDVTDLHAGAVTGETTRAERGQAALVGQTRERVVLVHELRQLAGAEELLDGGDDGPDVDQGLRRDGLDVLRGHALADDALHAGQAGADLVLDQLAHVAQTAVAEVVDVIDLDAYLDGLAVAVAGHGQVAGVQGDDVTDRGDDVSRSRAPKPPAAPRRPASC